MKIHCLINNGHSIDSDEISQLLFDSAQEVFKRKTGKMRIRLESIGLNGEIMTKYVVGFLGAIGGIQFTANIDWNDGSSKTDFLVKPVKDRDDLIGAKWIKVPLFPIQHEAECSINN